MRVVVVICAIMGLGLWLISRGREPSVENGVVVSIAGGVNIEPGLKKVVEAYRKRRPDAQIRLELKGGGVGVGYEAWLSTQLASRAPRPDIVSSNFAPTYGSYLNFDDYRQIQNPHSGRPWEKDMDFDFFNGRNVRGERFCLATQSVKVVWYFNRTAFEKLGLRPPATWTELIQLFDALRRAGHVPHTIKFNPKYYQWLTEVLWDQFTRPLIQKVRAQPGDWCFRPEVDGKWTYDPADPFNDAAITINYARLLRAYREKDIRLDGETFVTVLRALKQIADYAPPGFATSTASDETEAHGLFLRQEALVHLDGMWASSQLAADMLQLAPMGKDFAWDTFDTPSLEGPLVQAQARAVESACGEYLGVVYKNQPKADTAMDFVRFWLSPEGYQAYVDGSISAGGFNPSGQIMISGVKVPDQYASFESMQRRGNAETPLNALFQLAPAGSKVRRDMLFIMADFAGGLFSAEEAGRRLQKTIDDGFEEILQRYGLSPADLEHPERRPST